MLPCRTRLFWLILPCKITKTNAFMSKETEKKREIARVLYMAGKSMEDIASQVDISRQTISRWAAAGAWAEARAAQNITRPELVNKLLRTINQLIDQVNASDDPSLIDGLADKLAKFSAVITKLDKKAGVVDAIEVFMAFNKWLQFRRETDPDLTPELIKAINKYQDKFITEMMSNELDK